MLDHKASLVSINKDHPIHRPRDVKSLSPQVWKVWEVWEYVNHFHTLEPAPQELESECTPLRPHDVKSLSPHVWEVWEVWEHLPALII